MNQPTKKFAVVAIGGNSLIQDAKHQAVEDQYQAAKQTTFHIADMIEAAQHNAGLFGKRFQTCAQSQVLAPPCRAQRQPKDDSGSPKAANE